MLLPWLEAGYSYDEFWRRTPRETDLIMRGEEFRRIRQYNDAMLLAWSTANLSRVKRMPALKSLRITKRYRPQTWQDQLSIMKALTKANTERKRNG